MAHGTRTIGIVGGGLAAGRAAATLRTEGFDGRIFLVTDEQWVPYDRPPLTKAYLAGSATESDTFTNPAAFYDDHEIELIRSTTATRIDPSTAELELTGAVTMRFDSLLVATGASARKLDVPGAQLGNVLSLRSMAEARVARDLLVPGANLVCVGAGWIGMEVAATARGRGCTVSVVAPHKTPLGTVLGSQLGDFYRHVHEDHGVRFHLGRGVAELRGTGVVDSVVLDDETTIPADVVVVGIGAIPRVSLLATAGADLALAGVATDAQLRTSLPGIYAAGDIAAAQHPLLGARVRVEHWANALNQGPCAARNMLGHNEAYDRLPYFYSDQYDLSMEYAGLASSSTDIIVRRTESEHSFSAFWLDHADVVLAGMTMNSPGGIESVEALVRRRHRIDRTLLADAAIPLDLVAERAGATS
jgi:3-phenylpropionate/trans-cinnamate dioxygenase ferredoxin reductase component